MNLENAKWECGLVLLDVSQGAPEFHRGPDYHLEPSIAELRLHVGGDTHVAEMTQLLEELLIEQESRFAQGCNNALTAARTPTHEFVFAHVVKLIFVVCLATCILRTAYIAYWPAWLCRGPRH